MRPLNLTPPEDRRGDSAVQAPPDVTPEVRGARLKTIKASGNRNRTTR